MDSPGRYSAIVIAIGLTLCGYLIGNGLYKGRVADRYVTVKGLAEREVDADLAIWPITFTQPSNDLIGLEKDIRTKSEAIIAFLKRAGFDDGEITIGVPSITDSQASDYYSGERKQFRYLGKGRLTVNTTQVDLLRSTMSRTTELIGEGVVVSEQGYDARVQYIFTGLNDIKPSMIEEATVNARKAAEKFAGDSGSELGAIRRADQGLFSINDRDYNSPHKKKVRVVSTVQYLLED